MDADPEGADAEDRVEALTGRQETRISYTRGKPIGALASLAVIAVALIADYLLFKHQFDTNYFHWYIANGAKFALALSIFSVAITLDDEPGLIAANPSEYLSAWFFFFGIGFIWLGDIGDARQTKRAEWLDLVAVGWLWIFWAVAVGAWLLVIVPALYFITLVAGAPVRRTQATPQGSQIEVEPAKETDNGPDSRPRTFNMVAHVKERPVSTSNAIAAGLLYGLSLVV